MPQPGGGGDANAPFDTGQSPDQQSPHHEPTSTNARTEETPSPASYLRTCQFSASKIRTAIRKLMSSLNSADINSLDVEKLDALRALALEMAGDAKMINGILELIQEDKMRQAEQGELDDIQHRNQAVLENLQCYFSLDGNVCHMIPGFSKAEIHAKLMKYRSSAIKEEGVRKQTAHFHDCLSLFNIPAILARMVSDEKHGCAQKGAASDQLSSSVSQLFREDSFDNHLKLVTRNEEVKNASNKQSFIATVNVYIGYTVLNDIVKRSHASDSNDQSSSTPHKGAGNPKAKARSLEITRLLSAVQAAGGDIARNTLKTHLQLGDTWRSCIEPFKEGVWKVLPIYEFFKAVQGRGKHISPDKLPLAYVKTLFECIQETKPLFDYLKGLCDNTDEVLGGKWGKYPFPVLNLYRELYSNRALVESEISWTFLIRPITAERPKDIVRVYKGDEFETFQMCIEAFEECYKKGDYECFTKGKFWPQVISLLADGHEVTLRDEEVEPLWGHMSLSSQPHHKLDNAAMFEMCAQRRAGSRPLKLSAFLYDEQTENMAIALFTFPILSEDKMTSPFIYTAGKSTDMQTWHRMAQDLFPLEADTPADMMHPKISTVHLIITPDLLPSDKQGVLDLRWALRVFDMLSLIFMNDILPIGDDEEMATLDMTRIGKFMMEYMSIGLHVVAKRARVMKKDAMLGEC